MTRGERLQALVRAHKVSPGDLAAITGAAPATVRAWLRPTTSKAHREPVEAVVRLMALFLESKPKG